MNDDLILTPSMSESNEDNDAEDDDPLSSE